MKGSEIEIGGLYSNGQDGKGERLRRVTGTGEAYKLYPSQADTDCIGYVVVHRGTGKRVGQLLDTYSGQCTRISFASWAKARLADV